MIKKKKLVTSLSYFLIVFSILGISGYLYKNSNIREKSSFASSIGLSSEDSLQPARPSYEFIEFDTGLNPSNASISKFAQQSDGKLIIGGSFGKSGTKTQEFPAFWSEEGKLLEYFYKEGYNGGFLIDLNDVGYFTTQYFTHKEDYSSIYKAFFQKINSQEVIELTSPSERIPQVASESSLLKNESVLQLKKKLETLAPNGVGLSIFNQLYSQYLQIVPFSVNSNGDVGGGVFTEKGSISVVWLDSQEHKPLNLSSIISDQLGENSNATYQNIYLIDDKKNIWANSNGDGIVKLGYFEYVGANKWKLRQSWESPYSTYYTDLTAHNDKYSIVRQDKFGETLTSNNYVYYKRAGVSRFISKNPFEYKYKIEDVLQKVVPSSIEYVGVMNLNKENELIGLFIADNSMDFFIMNIETKSIQLVSDLIETGSIQLPAGVEFGGINMIDDNGNLYGQFFRDWNLLVGALKKL